MMRKITMLAFAALFLISIVPNAQAQQWEDTSGYSDFFGTGPTSPQRKWLPLALAAVAICLFANTLIYVGAKAFGMPSWERFAKAEFFQVTVSALMITSFVALVEFGFEFSMATLLPKGSTTLCAGYQEGIYQFAYGPIGAVQCKLQDKINYGYKLYGQIYQTNKAVEAKTATCISVLNVQVYCGDWIPYFHDTMEKAHTLAHQVVPMTISLVGQYMFLDYIAKNAFAILLPLGIILRIIPVFRGIGGLLIAVAIGFYMVFPLTYLMLDPTTVRAEPSLNTKTEQKACYAGFGGAISAVNDAFATAGSASANEPMIDMNQVGKELGRMRIEVIFYPLVALGATIVFIQSAAPFFGGDSGQIVHFISKVV